MGILGSVMGILGSVMGILGSVMGILVSGIGNLVSGIGNLVRAIGNLAGVMGNLAGMMGNIVGVMGNLAGVMRNFVGMMGNLIRNGVARWHNIDNLWVLGDIRRTDTSKVGECRVDLLLGFAPGMNTGGDLLSELGRWAEAAGITVGVALGDREPSVQALRNQLRAWSRDNWRGGNGRAGRVGRAWRRIGHAISCRTRWAHGSGSDPCGSHHGSRVSRAVGDCGRTRRNGDLFGAPNRRSGPGLRGHHGNGDCGCLMLPNRRRRMSWLGMGIPVSRGRLSGCRLSRSRLRMSIP
jgi:hypothetical protein